MAEFATGVWNKPVCTFVREHNGVWEYGYFDDERNRIVSGKEANMEDAMQKMKSCSGES